MISVVIIVLIAVLFIIALNYISGIPVNVRNLLQIGIAIIALIIALQRIGVLGYL